MSIICGTTAFIATRRNVSATPTQKPEALLDRIIKSTTQEGDVVLDPFMGGGTTIAVAERLNRQWIGIDQSVQAVKVTELRMKKLCGSFEKVVAEAT